VDVTTLIDAIVRQTTVLVAQLATAGGGRAQLSQTANRVFLDLVAALKEQGLSHNVIADMFGLALRTYHSKMQRLLESQTVRGSSLWEALLEVIESRGPILRAELLSQFDDDDPIAVRGVLKDLVDSELVFRSGRGDRVQYQAAETGKQIRAQSSPDAASNLVWLATHRTGPTTVQALSALLRLEAALVQTAVEQLVADGRVQAGAEPNSFVTKKCVLPLGEALGWEAALFDHYQAMVQAICVKLAKGKTTASEADLCGGSTFSYRVWPGHPFYEQVTRGLSEFRQRGIQLRRQVAEYNRVHAAPDSGAVRVLSYVGQALMEDDSLAETATPVADEEGVDE
jgi:hypothetical protein